MFTVSKIYSHYRQGMAEGRFQMLNYLKGLPHRSLLAVITVAGVLATPSLASADAADVAPITTGLTDLSANLLIIAGAAVAVAFTFMAIRKGVGMVRSYVKP